MISAPQKSSGKTIVSLGILYYLRSKGISVRSFKKGPDYIDPMWHKVASGNECYNLDPYLTGTNGCLELFLKHSIHEKNALSLIEGNHGLHDGMSLDGSDSSAGLAATLKTPVLLVVDSRKINRGIAALVMGIQAMPPHVILAGVILNQVRGQRQVDKQKQAIEEYCKVPVLGAIPIDEELVIPERHLGLTTVEETVNASKFIQGAAERLMHYCDMHAINSLFYQAPPLPLYHTKARASRFSPVVKIGVFRDAAFCFYYPDNLNALRDQGAELVFIDAFHERLLPDVDALYLGGGFPELFFEALCANKVLLREVRERVESGLPLYAECGGLIYLSRGALYEGKQYALTGILPLDIGFQQRPAGHGYLDLRSNRDSAWFRKDTQIRAHEFHYATPLMTSGNCSYQFDVLRGYGVTGKRDGVLYRNLFASFAHLHAAGNPEWAETFVSLAAQFKATGDIV
ncbi:MAG: cobyrinate a,c-diamide synthase [Chlorobiaceae bacterium]